MRSDILKKLPKRDREIVESWIKSNDEREDPKIRAALERSVDRTLEEWDRATHGNVALDFVVSRIEAGETIEHMIQSWHGSGGYLVALGIGHGFMDQKIRSDELGVRIRTKGSKIFRLRQLYAEAERVVAQKRSGQGTLFA